MRAFVAVDVPELVGLPGIPDPPPMAARHFTLRFLSEIDEEQIRRADPALREVGSRLAPFSVALRGIGALPDWNRPRIVFVSILAGRPELEALARSVNDALVPLGLPTERRPFLPHVTVLRVRSSSDAATARRLSETCGDRLLAESRVGEFLLKESELLPSGAQHHTVGRYPLTSTG